MSVKLIAENLLEKDNFLSATEQEGEHWAQPVPGINSGSMRPVTFRMANDPHCEDLVLTGTTTGDGNVGGTTLIDSELDIFGDDYFIGGEIEITSGAYDGEIRTISDFVRTTGTVTVSVAFTGQIVTGVTYTLTVYFATRDFRFELIGSGDPGDATFKWSHDGAVTYFGRNDPDNATWLGHQEPFPCIYDTADRTPIVLKLANGNWICIYREDAPGGTDIRVSSDKGLTWGSRVVISSSYTGPDGAIILKSGRILVSSGTAMIYSDDDGATWHEIAGYAAGGDMVELPNGNIIKVTQSGTGVICYISYDSGLTFGDVVIISDTTNNQRNPKITLTEHSDIIVVYDTDEASAGDYEIKAKKSTDGGATWGSAIDVIDYAVATRTYPHICRDIDGSLYCVAEYDSGGKLVFTRSVDNGDTWAAEADLFDQADLCRNARINLLDGHLLICSFINATDDYVGFVRRGMWELYSANACPCAPNAMGQVLICKAEIIWYGGLGIAGDDWSFEAEYDFAMSNLIEDSPAQAWRSEQDNIACNIVIDFGTMGAYLVDSIGFFNCNIRTLDFQMNASDTWGSPSVDEAVSFDLATGTIDALNINAIKDTSLLAGYKDHQLKDCYFRATSGTDSGKTWKIIDNVGDFIMLEITGATALAISDTFVVFQPYIAYTFSNSTTYRFIRIAISAQQTAEDYYQIGSIVLGHALTLSLGFSSGYDRTHRYGVDYLRTPGGAMVPVKSAGRKRLFSLTWNIVSDTQRELEYMLDYVEGKNVVLIPDDTNLKQSYLVKRIDDFQNKHVFSSWFDLAVNFEEVL